MKYFLLISYVFFVSLTVIGDTLNTQESIYFSDTALVCTSTENIYKKRLLKLDKNTPMDLSYNDNVLPFIESYIGKNKSLISRMLTLKELYFPVFEQHLDQYNLPLELKYLAIVESALNPKARSASGATGLWQFMYLTGKQYNLNVSSYVDERQDPYKSTEAACLYFTWLYNLFGDWNLVLAAYNGGPGYLQKKINSVGSTDFWELYPYLRTETRNYIPTFIAVNYIMNYANEHFIYPNLQIAEEQETDTIKIKCQVELKTLSNMLCVEKEIINYLNPAFKKEIYPKDAVIVLPTLAVSDFNLNDEAYYNFIMSVNQKEILIEEERVVYIVEQGDYLGRIAKNFNVHIYEIKQWNDLLSSDLDVGDKLVIYKPIAIKESVKNKNQKNEYTIQKGDTLWGIAKKYNGLSIWKIKSLNNLDDDFLMPGTKIILPNI